MRAHDAQSAALDVNQHRMKTPLVFDCGPVAAAYLNSTSFSTPHVFLIDASGRIRNDFDPSSEALFGLSGLSAEVEKWLGAGPAPKKK